jgi:RNA polymerase sigma-70 factor (ECF subfamily)
MAPASVPSNVDPAAAGFVASRVGGTGADGHAPVGADVHAPVGADVHPRARADAATADASTDDSDETLMRAYAAGDTAAFARLYDRHERAAWRFIRHRLGPAHEAAADDVLQETWISVARAAARYEATARFTTWLLTIARHKVVDHLRALDASTVSLDAPPPGTDGDPEAAGDAWSERLPGDPAAEPVARLASRQQARALLDALDQLPGEQREAFVLQAEGGMSVEEVAAATGVGAETAKSRLRYARTKLRALLAAWSPA